ncbi:MAG: potassium channel family protein [Prosthecobacter sp.]|uniref:ion channel n=1 Tax=Prosthecobacter sp. TaxID=1965333 RepID=UPI0025DC2835|nr:ion channel [Prosthecobacter sp.]MCF7786334.1 potassium channel family protein [Prosthecobacter sp.]
MKKEPGFAGEIIRQGGEVVAIVLVAALLQALWGTQWLSARTFCLVVLAAALAKTVFFFVENLQHILMATRDNMPYHRVLGLMGVNMIQITLAFAMDYWCLETAEPASFSSIDAAWSQSEQLFEFFFFSVLNFSFFGFGDVTPLTIPAKLVTMMEVLLAFFTVIFLLSDFVSLKDSLRVKKPNEE